MMDIRKKAAAAAILMALAVPVTMTLNVPSVFAAPATQTQASDAFQVDFKNGQPQLFEASDGWTNGNPFNVFWHKENVTFSDNNSNFAVLKRSINS